MSETDGIPAGRGVDARLVPAAVVAWAAMWFATVAAPGHVGVAAAVAVLVATVSAVRRRWSIALAALVAAACLASGGVRAWGQQSHPLAAAAQAKAVVEVEVAVAGEPRLVPARGHREALRVLPVEVGSLQVRGSTWRGSVPAVVIAKDAPAWSELVVGTRVAVTARVGAAEPGERAVAVLKPLTEPRVRAGPGPVLALVERLRAGLRAATAPLWPEARALVPALVLGDVTGIPPELGQDFKTTGLTHLTAVSGSNLALLLAFVGTAAARVGVRGWWLRALGVVTALGFVVLCRAEPSVVRAAAMGLVMLTALGSGAKGARGLRHLAVAVVALMLLDPWLSRSAGFALSVLASSGIILLARPWAKALSWLPGWMAEAVAVPLAAQVATQPVVTALSGQVTVTGLVANAVAGPLVGPATVAGLVATLLWWAPPLAVVAAALAGVCASGIVLVARVGAGMPGAAWEWPATPPALVVVTLACAAAVALTPSLLRRRWACVLLTVLMGVLAVRAPSQPAWPPRAWAVVACDVGQGDATVVDAGAGAAIVVDTGPDPAPLERCLSQLGVTSIPLLVLSHDHADHVGGLPAALRRPVGTVLLSGVPSPGRDRLIASLAAARDIRVASQGEAFRAGEAEWVTIAAPSAVLTVGESAGESSAENDGSIVGVATSGGVATLMGGDTEPAGQAAAAAAGLPPVTVVKVPHHGSGRQDPGFLQTSGARVALIGVGVNNDYGHPAAKTLRLLGAAGMRVARTDQHGSIAVGRRGDVLVVTTQRGRA